MFWQKLHKKEINNRVFQALKENTTYKDDSIFGIPGTFLEQNIFYGNAPFLKDAPYLQTLINNPNHIGCHTLDGGSEPFFKGTQKLEKEVIGICAEQIFRAQEKTYDGYITSGGTEANIQALWVYRNYFIKEHKAKLEEIAVIYSEDTHYSFAKGTNVLSIQSLVVKVDPTSREIDLGDFQKTLHDAQKKGIKHFIVIQNLATTMFGSIDHIEKITSTLIQNNISFKLHVDAAFGGFIVPFVKSLTTYSFQNNHISSITLDGHKMLQAPFGTGIFIIRKNLLPYVETQEAKYVHGHDFTLCGSRSGANAVALWMILMINGSHQWANHIQQLIKRTHYLCQQLDELNIPYYRNPACNIVTLQAESIPVKIAQKYRLVPNDTKGNMKWWKIVVMEHVSEQKINTFIEDLKQEPITDVITTH